MKHLFIIATIVVHIECVLEKGAMFNVANDGWILVKSNPKLVVLEKQLEESKSFISPCPIGNYIPK